MNETGIIRRMDDLGRIVIPREVRQSLNLKEGDPFEIYFDRKSKIVGFKKWTSCDRINNLKEQFELLSEEERIQFLKEIQ